MTFWVACTLFGASAIGLFLSLRLVHRRALRLTLVILCAVLAALFFLLYILLTLLLVSAVR